MTLGILGYLFYTARNTHQFRDLSWNDLNWGWLTIAILSCLAAHVVSYLRWRILVRALDIPFSIFDAIRIGFIGSFFTLFAFGLVGGDSLRAFYVTRQVKHRVPEAIASVLADRMIGLLTMFSFASVAFLTADIFNGSNLANPNKMSTLIHTCRVIMIATVIGYGLLTTLLFVPQLTRNQSFQRLTELPKAGSLFKRLANVLNVYRTQLPAVGFCFLLSSVCVIFFTISIFSVALAISNSHPSFTQHFIITPIAMTANAIPSAGGIGGMELAVDFLYTAFAPENRSDRSIVIAFTFRSVLLVTSAIGGIAWFLNRRSFKNIRENPEPDTPK